MKKWVLFILVEIAVAYSIFYNLFVKDDTLMFIYYTIAFFVIVHFFYKYFIKEKD